jgi:hypothetical protein
MTLLFLCLAGAVAAYVLVHVLVPGSSPFSGAGWRRAAAERYRPRASFASGSDRLAAGRSSTASFPEPRSRAPRARRRASDSGEGVGATD